MRRCASTGSSLSGLACVVTAPALALAASAIALVALGAVGAAVAAAAAGGSAPDGATAAAASAGSNWPSYLFSARHASSNAGATTITTANAGSLTASWTWMPPAPPLPALGEAITSSPTVYKGVIYVGANNGSFYALSESTGAILWSDFVGYVTSHTPKCGSHGFVSTATVATDPTTKLLTVYVAGADGYLSAFNAATGAVVWRSVVGIPSTTQNDYFDWSSPAVSHGHVYIGISSQCDDPLVRGGLLSFNQTTGTQQAAFYSVPSGDVGGSLWSSPAVSSNGTVYVTTGNGPSTDPSLGYSISVVALNGSTLAVEGSWQVPAAQQFGTDSDFGGSPTLFSAVLSGTTTPTPLVGACNKNGVYYALKQKDLGAGPVWQQHVGSPSLCLAAAPWDGSHLWLTSEPSETSGPGTVYEVNPGTGAVLWTNTVPGPILGSPSLDGSGVLAVPSDTKGGSTYLFDASTGTLLATVTTNSQEFAQPVYAGPYLFLATAQSGLIAYRAA
jgi:outer membrane protein assembly factor BamB